MINPGSRGQRHYDWAWPGKRKRTASPAPVLHGGRFCNGWRWWERARFCPPVICWRARQQRASARRLRPVHCHTVPPFYTKVMEGKKSWQPGIHYPHGRRLLARRNDGQERHRHRDAFSDDARCAGFVLRQVRAGAEARAAKQRLHATTRAGLPRALRTLRRAAASDTDGSLREIEYAVRRRSRPTLSASWTSYADKWPYDPVFAPVYDEELNRRKAVIFIHSAAADLLPRSSAGVIGKRRGNMISTSREPGGPAF